ncbi:hypothetical protein BTS2_1202 [Bacillus sp. TS-2]|nr:hypothetical protein BTS2_1202 [Bacillus sp. TS-2]
MTAIINKKATAPKAIHLFPFIQVLLSLQKIEHSIFRSPFGFFFLIKGYDNIESNKVKNNIRNYSVEGKMLHGNERKSLSIL